MEDLLNEIPTHFRVQDKLGSGVTSGVFRARDTAAGRTVALKVMHAPASDGLAAAQQARVEREFRAAGRLHDLDGVLKVFNVGTTQSGGSWIAMELAEHGTLADWLLGDHELSLLDCAQVLAGILAILQTVHERDVVHGDVSPSNIFFRDTYVHSIALGDFGLCRIDEEAHSGGFTPVYAAPELFHGAPATPSTDCFAAAMAVEECLSHVVASHEPDDTSSNILHELRRVIAGLSTVEPQQRTDVTSALSQLAALGR